MQKSIRSDEDHIQTQGQLDEAQKQLQEAHKQRSVTCVHTLKANYDLAEVEFAVFW